MPKCPECKAPVLTVPNAVTGELLMLDPEPHSAGILVLAEGKAYPVLSTDRRWPLHRLHHPRCTGPFPTAHIDERPRR